jgi:Holliday junction resolvase RusA-like endonuclease
MAPLLTLKGAQNAVAHGKTRQVHGGRELRYRQGQEQARNLGQGKSMYPGDVRELQQEEMKALLHTHILGRPVQWQRMRGDRNRYKPTNLKAWQEKVADVLREEISIEGLDNIFPGRNPVKASVIICYETMEELNKAPDGDNIIKGILDAMTGIVYIDDKPRYLRGLSLDFDIARTEEQIGTHITVYDRSSL